MGDSSSFADNRTDLLDPEHFMCVPPYQIEGDVLDKIEAMAAELKEDGITSAHVPPLFKAYARTPGGIPSPYALYDGLIDPRYTEGVQLNADQTVKRIGKIVQTYHDNGLRLFMDFVPNHVGAEINLSVDSPIFGKFAKAVKWGEVTEDDVLCPPEVKRYWDTSGSWTDTREGWENDEEQVNNYIRYVAEPALDFFVKCARGNDPARKNEAVDTRLDATNMSNSLFWQKFMPIMLKKLSGEDGTRPMVLLETIDDLSHYNHVFGLFPEDMKGRVVHQGYKGHFKMVNDSKVHPFERFEQISKNNQDPIWEDVHDETFGQDMTAGIDDWTHDIVDGQVSSHSTWFHKHGLSWKDEMICNRIAKTDKKLTARNSYTSYGAHVSDHFRQSGIFSGNKVDLTKIREEGAVTFNRRLNATHTTMHRKRYHWYETAHTGEHRETSLVIAHPHMAKNAAGQMIEQAPVLAFTNALDETISEQDVGKFIEKTHRDNCAYKGLNYIEPEEVHLTGTFNNEQISAVTRRYPMVFLNGKKYPSIALAYDQGMVAGGTGTLGHNEPGYQPS